MPIKKLSIIIPVFNEEKTIELVLRRMAMQDLGGRRKEIIVVDDGSTDDSGRIIRRYLAENRIENVILAALPTNRGKGAAIRTGLKNVTGDAVIIQDADLEYDINDWPKLIKTLEEDPRVASVYGSRNLRPERRGYPLYILGVWILTRLNNLLFGSKLTDIYTCYKLFRTDAVKNLDIASEGFEFEMEVTAKLLKRGYKISEIPINYYPRKFSEGKKIRARDGLKGIWTLLKYKFRKR